MLTLITQVEKSNHFNIDSQKTTTNFESKPRLDLKARFLQISALNAENSAEISNRLIPKQ